MSVTAFTDQNKYFVSEVFVYRLLKSHDPISVPVSIGLKAADECRDKTTAPKQMGKMDLTSLNVIGWGWRYHSIIDDDDASYIVG